MDVSRSVLPARNIELKARLRDLNAAREVAQQLATEYLGVQWQTDTYFNCTQGRLKLREIEGRTAQLISYSRPDESASKASDYLLVDVTIPARLKLRAASALGILAIVEKRREIFLHHNVRIHLDEVTGLGTFLEFESVLNPEIDDVAGRAQVAKLQLVFGIADSDLIAESYSDMLLGKK